MRRSLFVAVPAALLVAAAAYLAWRHFAGDERLIEETLRECAEAAAFRPGEAPAGALLKLRRLESRTEPEIAVSLRVRGRSIHETLAQKELVSRLAASRKYLSSLEIDLGDLAIAVSGDTAVAEASVQLRGTGGSERKSWQDTALEDVKITLVRREGRWRVARVTGGDFMEK